MMMMKMKFQTSKNSLPVFERNDPSKNEDIDEELETNHTTTFLSTEEEEEDKNNNDNYNNINNEIIDLTGDDEPTTQPITIKEEGASVVKIKQEEQKATATGKIGAADTVGGDQRLLKVEPEEEIKSYKDTVTTTPKRPTTPILRSPTRMKTPGRTSKHKQNNGQRRSINTRYELRSNPNPSRKVHDAKGGDVNYMFLQLEEHPTLRNRMSVQKWFADFIFTQMHYTKGVKKHGEAAIAAIVKEVQQLDDLKVFNPIMANSLTPEE